MRFFLKLLPAYGFCRDRLLAAGKMGGSNNQMFKQLQKVDWSPRTTGTTIQHKRVINTGHQRGPHVVVLQQLLDRVTPLHSLQKVMAQRVTEAVAAGQDRTKG